MLEISARSATATAARPAFAAEAKPTTISHGGIMDSRAFCGDAVAVAGHVRMDRQIVQMIISALPQELFLAAISAGVTADSDIDHCCETMAQLAIGQQEQLLAREFFNREQKAGEDDMECARNLQHLFRAGVRPPTIAAKLHAVKTDDLNHLVKAATRKHQELLLTLASNRWPNSTGPRWTPLRWTPRAGEPYYSFFCLLQNASRPFLRVSVKVEGYPCCLLLESGAVKSLVNLQAFLNLRSKFCTCLSSINLLSAEWDSGIVGALFLSEPTRHQWRKTQNTDPDTALVYERFLTSSYKPTGEEMNSSSKEAKRIWRQWSKLTLEDEVLWYQEDATSPKPLLAPGSLMQAVLQEFYKQLRHVGQKKMVEASSKRC
ncbi:unnamed protein product [Taenia asiatica]|uniref:DUF5726 domain-containing protein n=1 Tax=Taenia asiatica TaxID=60517 RepID=A0A0R3W1L3_TAEAS|nr:unnamed protein product [Taenia asiatica]